MRDKTLILRANAKKLDVKRRHHALTGMDRMQLFYTDINIVRMLVLFNNLKSAGLKAYIQRLRLMIIRLLEARKQTLLIDHHICMGKLKKSLADIGQSTPLPTKKYCHIFDLRQKNSFTDCALGSDSRRF